MSDITERGTGAQEPRGDGTPTNDEQQISSEQRLSIDSDEVPDNPAEDEPARPR